MGFREVSGLATEMDIIRYRARNSPAFDRYKIPTATKVDVSLKKGLSPKNETLFQWINESTFGKIERKRVTIQLSDETGAVLFTWTLTNAFPVKIIGSDFNALNSEMAIEELVLAHEGVRMEAA